MRLCARSWSVPLGMYVHSSMKKYICDVRFHWCWPQERVSWLTISVVFNCKSVWFRIDAVMFWNKLNCVNVNVNDCLSVGAVKYWWAVQDVPILLPKVTWERLQQTCDRCVNKRYGRRVGGWTWRISCLEEQSKIDAMWHQWAHSDVLN